MKANKKNGSRTVRTDGSIRNEHRDDPGTGRG